MKRLISLSIFILLLCIGNVMLADEKITVSSTNEDISQNLDLRVIAKLFAESKNLEEFEENLNKPDNNYSNLDLNGDGIVDYIRVVESGEGNKRLIILQVILAKDIYQDVASIFVEKDANDQVSVQIVGDEFIYGTNYIIEPYYFYRPYIYDWFWGSSWVRWNSPYYWDYYPGWWYHHHPLGLYDYYGHCHRFCSHHVCCSYHHGKVLRPTTRSAIRNSPVKRDDFARANATRSFASRNANVATNASFYDRSRMNSTRLATRSSAPAAASVRSYPTNNSRTTTRSTSPTQRSGVIAQSATRSINNPTAATRSATTRNNVSSISTTSTRTISNSPNRTTSNTTRTFGSSNVVNATRTGGATRSTSTTSPSARTLTRQSSVTRSTPSTRTYQTNSVTVTRPSTSSSYQRSSTTTSSNRVSSSYSSPRISTSSSRSSSSTRSSGSYSSGSSTRSSGGYSGGSRSSGSSSGGGTRSTRR